MKKRVVIAACLCVLLLAIFWIPAPAPPVPIVRQFNLPWLNGSPQSVGRDGTVYVRAGFGLLAFDQNGKQKWTAPAEVMVASSPAIAPDGTIYLKEWERPKLLTDGTYSTNKGLLALHPDGTVKWRFSINEIVENSGVAFAVDSRSTVYFTAGKDFSSPKTLFAVGTDGSERWHFDAPGNATAPVGISGDGTILFESRGKTNADFYRLDAGGKCLDPTTKIEDGSSSFSIGWNGTTFLPGDVGNTMTALNADGSLRWRFKSPLRAFEAPTIGTDGSLYFTAIRRMGQIFLVALTKDGKEKWKFDLGSHFNFQPPTVASDGTLFIVSGDPKVTALNPDGTVKWVFQPPRPHVPMQIPKSWQEVQNQWHELFRRDRNVLGGRATLTPEGMLYVGFGGPYDTIYALNAGVGLATNSPWPMASGDLQMTWRVQERASDGTAKQTH